MPKVDLRLGVTEPVLFAISRQQVEPHDLAETVEVLNAYSTERPTIAIGRTKA